MLTYALHLKGGQIYSRHTNVILISILKMHKKTLLTAKNAKMTFLNVKFQICISCVLQCKRKLHANFHKIIRAGNSGIRSFDFWANCTFFVEKWANERFAQKISIWLIRSFLVSNQSNSLMIAHFLWATWANCSWSLIFGEQPEGFAHIPHLIWVKWAIHSHRSPKKRKWGKMTFG